jgi:hypothetical protein
MGKTERILSYLPPTFSPYPRPSLLFTVTDAVGQRLLEADNLLVEVMRAHWVDFADQRAKEIRDLARLAALFDLQPRDDEDVETFRTHLKSYVRTYLQGSATIRGVLRLAASTLALSIEDELEPQPGDPLFLVDTIQPGDDATFKLFGFKAAEVHGIPPAPAQLVGQRDLSGGVDLSGGSTLQLAIDRDNIATVDVAGRDPKATSLWEIARKINAALGIPAASHDGHTLELTSGLAGPDGEIQVGSLDGDAADVVLGIAPRVYQGSADRPAQVCGTVDHAPASGISFVDLSQARYLRLAIDGGLVVEVDCAGADPAATTLDEVRDKINAAAGAAVASHDGHFLTLTSPTTGAASRLELLPAPANDARERLLGPGVRRVNRGGSAASARLASRADLHLGVELPPHSALRLRIDGGEAQDVALTGDESATRSLTDLADLINVAFGAQVASHDGRHLILTSPTTGAGSRIEVLTPAEPASDATGILLGVLPRSYQGAPPGPARLSGLVTLEEPLDLRRQRRLWLSVDGGSLLVIDCAGTDPARTRLQDIVDAINQAAGTTVAFHEEGRLILQSPTSGATSALVLRAPETTTRRFFYTRGRVREDAATTLFGFAAGQAEGRLPEPARLTGTVDLSRGADLRVAHSLQLLVDDRDPVDIRVADSARPLVTLLPHIIAAINAALGAHVASDRDGRLELTSPTEGPQGRIAIGTSTASDAGQVLFGLPPGNDVRGRPAEQVQFVGMGDLARGLDVTDTFRLRAGIDDRPLTDVDLRTAVPADSPPILSPGQIAEAINQALGRSYASHDGRHVILTSQETGSASKLTIEPAPPNDATQAVFGLSQARSYTGQDATAARLIGQVDLSGGADLRERRHLSLEIDGQLVADIDCAGADPTHTSLAEIIARINAAAGAILRGRPPVAGQSDGRLVILSPTTGGGSSVVLRQSSAADARPKLLGDAPTVALGQPGQPAVLTGQAKLSRPVDLSQRPVIRLRVDGGGAQDIECTGERPDRTFPDEVVDRINTVFPGLAALDSQRRLVLTATRWVELLALRYFTMFEFPPVATRSPDQPVHHGVAWSVTNDSIRDEPVEWVLTSLHGVDRPRLTNRDTGGWVQVNAVIPAGFTLHVRLDEALTPGAGLIRPLGVRAWMDAPDRTTRDLTGAVEIYPGPDVLRLPIGESHWQYGDCYGDRFEAAYFGRRSRRGRPRPLPVVPGHFAGGEVCHSPGAFNLSRFYNPEQPGTETVFGSRTAAVEPQATSGFAYLTHQAGQFELQLPTDLPPQFGGRFNIARFAGESVTYVAAIFDLPEDPQALDEQVKVHPSMVTARVELIPDEGVPIYDVPFKDDKPLVGGSKDTYARVYLRQPGVPGVVELRAGEVGAWGNLIVVSAPDSATPGAFDVTVTYTGRDMFENARQKVAEQLAFARAAGVLARVTRR